MTEDPSFQAMDFAAGATMLAACRGCAAFALPEGHSPRHALVVGEVYENSYPATAEVLAVGD